jgi:hypothetical protein
MATLIQTALVAISIIKKNGGLSNRKHPIAWSRLGALASTYYSERFIS